MLLVLPLLAALLVAGASTAEGPVDDASDAVAGGAPTEPEPPADGRANEVPYAGSEAIDGTLPGEADVVRPVAPEDARGRRTEEVSILTALGVVTVAFWLLMLGLSWYLRCWRPRSKKPADLKRLLSPAEIERRFPAGNTDRMPTCVICLSIVEASEPCRTTQCGHIFHADCLEAWWMHKARRMLHCPVCRQRQTKEMLPFRGARVQPQLQMGVEELEQVERGEVAASVPEVAYESQEPARLPHAPEAWPADNGAANDEPKRCVPRP